MISQADPFDFEVFFDSGCPICRREIDWLKRLDRNRRVRFTDIIADGFEPSSIGKTRDELMAQIHGRLPSGEILVGVEVLRRLYEAVGFEKWVALSRWPIVRHVLEVGYWMFARLRPKLPRSRCVGESCQLASDRTK